MIETMNGNYAEIDSPEDKEMKVVTVLQSNLSSASSIIIQVSPNGSKILLQRDTVERRLG